jgi:NAD(P)-dependent dehydrogenase (short-subunit alcohol dehydrogenase family)
MKVLLLGVTGRVGSRLLPALLKHGHSVIALVRSESKLSPDVKTHLASTVVGSGADSNAIKSAILSHECDAVVNSAGLTSLTPLGKQGDLLKIFTAIVDAAVAVAAERGSPLRCWFLNGWSILDSPSKGNQIIDYVPLYPEHQKTYKLIKDKDPKKEIAWSLFCASNMPPRSDKITFPPPDTCSADNLIASADSPPALNSKWRGIPLLGATLNLAIQAGDYYAPLEDCVDFIAADLEKGLASEYVGHRVGVKVKSKEKNAAK